MVSDRTFRRVKPEATKERINLGLIKLRRGADSAATVRRLDAMLTPSVRAFSRADFLGREQSFWLHVKPIGVMFTAGVLVAMAVGTVILNQVLASEIQNRIAEYATLKAMGYNDRSVRQVILQQVAIFSLCGFVLAAGLATALYHPIRARAGLPLEMEWPRTLLVAGLTVVMGAFASQVSSRKLRRADPADLFR
jgi:putative ABC transport system permease protein